MNLSGNLSSDDLDKVNDRNNPPDTEGGFEMASSGGDDFDSLFDDFDDLDSFGGGSSNSGGSTFGDSSDAFGGSGNSESPFGGGSSNTFGNTSTFGGNASPFGTVPGSSGAFNNGTSPFGNSLGQGGFGGGGTGVINQQAIPEQHDTMDKAMDASIDAAKSLGYIMLELVKSIKLRNLDDFGYIGRNLTLAGVLMFGGGIILGIIGVISGVRFLSFAGMGTQTLLCGGLTLGTGLFSIGTAAFVLEHNNDCNIPADNIADAAFGDVDDATNDYEENIGDETDDLFGDDFDDMFGDFDFNDESKDNINKEEDKIEDLDISVGDIEDESNFNADGIVESVPENQYISRENLFNTFKPMFPLKTPKFSDKNPIENGSDLFLQIETACLKAIANIVGCEINDVNSKLEEAYDSFFSYELKMKRIKKMNKLDELSRELEIYFRESSEETGVNATVRLEGDFYKIVITKGVTAVVTFGDIFKQAYCEEFFMNTKKKLPVITGITELGKVILDDAKVFDTMLIAGKPRSGKSWYVLSILMSLMLFNSPEDIQFIVIDPKESNLFKVLSLMPHVCGIHSDSNILDVMDDIIKVEGARRKKLLADNECDDIWALRDKGIRLPILYLVIDEYITARNNLGDAYKDLDKRLQTIISQLPSQGVRIMFVPHRAMGIVDKTNRTMLQFTACVRSDQSEIIDTLDIKKWNRPLVNPGDIAIKTSSNTNPMYARGAALTTDDIQNAEFIKTAAKVFYKMGVDLPDMTNMTIACNRDNEYIREQLAEESTRLQFNAENILSDIN